MELNKQTYHELKSIFGTKLDNKKFDEFDNAADDFITNLNIRNN